MRGLVAFCVRHFGAVTALSAAALLLGWWGALRAPLDVFPEFVPSQVDIQTEAPGFAPKQVEELVTKRIESAVNGVAGLATLRSESRPGLSVVVVTFAEGIDVHVARQGIAERLSELGSSLPTGVGAPKLSPLVSSTMDLLKIGLVSDTLDPFALRDAADWLVKPRLLAVPCVAHVVNFGGAVRQVQILPDPRKLASYGSALSEVADGARGALALRGAGFIDLASQRVLLKSPTPAPDLNAIGQAVVAVRNTVPIRLRDVAEVRLAPALRSGDALIMGRPGVLMSLASQFGANTLSTTIAVEKELDALQPALKAQGITVYPRLHRPANFIEASLHDLRWSLSAAAVLVLDHYGQSLNTMTLGGFAVALGVFVDDAIIGIENILRRLRGNDALAEPLARLDVIREASLEVRGPVICATIVVIAVFLPALFASSVQGHFVGPLALSFILAVIASLLVAMTTTPALCALLLRARAGHADAGWLNALKLRQARAVRWVVANFKSSLAALVVLVVTAVAALPFLGGVFMPDFREGHFVMQVSSSLPGTSIDEMLGLGRRISADVLKLPYVALALILVVFFVAFRWRANGWLALVNLPFSLIGGVFAIAATGIGISLGSVVGLVTVFGVRARNAILQLAHYEHIVEAEGLPWGLDAALRGANERLVPILMTAAVTGLGLLPLAFGLHQPGEEIEGPMAVTVLGGLVSSTVLNLLVLPALAQRYCRPA